MSIAVPISAIPVSILMTGSNNEMPDLSAIISKIGFVAPNFCTPKNINPAATTSDRTSVTLFMVTLPKFYLSLFTLIKVIWIYSSHKILL